MRLRLADTRVPLPGYGAAWPQRRRCLDGAKPGARVVSG
jgi:hypothetical protein